MPLALAEGATVVGASRYARIDHDEMAVNWLTDDVLVPAVCLL